MEFTFKFAVLNLLLSCHFDFPTINCFSRVDLEMWPFEGKYPSYCNGYMYALKPKTAMKLAAVSQHTKYLPLDDIFVTGVLRDR